MKYQEKQIRKDIFTSCYIGYSEVIDFSSIDDLYCSSIDWGLGDHFYQYGVEEHEVQELKNILTSKLTLTKKEIELFNFEGATMKVMSDTYRNKYESELYNELYNHTCNTFSGLLYNFVNYPDPKSVHFSEGGYIRVSATRKQFVELCAESRGDYENQADFLEDADTIWENYVQETRVKKYDMGHFDYYGGRICIYNEWQKEVFNSLECEIWEVYEARKKHHARLKNQIKNNVPLQYREEA